ncbi:hypothetical protein [Lentzea flaviverrucosa]|uniref:Uncharacterized protein n=1 Tax=Lentzea flaviverrucosa TaxID=200379 RepID=A0A1H9B8R9_9PSEU|nr:hypothetical protein [Lentzea flaviverrucosa]RDI31846.1 hypothetical protein DFR72_103246 [Lentzea flaviverrucosa]SEP85412.1 hypothetical protein SAMN05216195_101411 [Lentzea flaviverrucosa]
MQPAEAGELIDVLEVAHFRIDSYTQDTDLSGAPGTHIDLVFADGYRPISPEDTFSERVDFVLDVVIRFALSFEWLAAQVPDARTLTGSQERAPVWRDGTLSHDGGQKKSSSNSHSPTLASASCAEPKTAP